MRPGLDINEMNTQQLNAYKAHLSDHLRKTKKELLITTGRLSDVNLRLDAGKGDIIDESV
jgi:hypothetical protein